MTHFLGIVKLSKTTVPINSICEEILSTDKKNLLKFKVVSGNNQRGDKCPLSQLNPSDFDLNLYFPDPQLWLALSWRPPPPQHTVTGQAERRSSMSWRGSCVYSLFYSLLLWMNPRVKEASKKMSGSLKSLDVAPVQRTIAEASQAPTLGVHTRQPGIRMLASLLTFPLSCVARGC